MISSFTKRFAGGIAPLLQRITGLLLLVYLLLHVLTIHKLSEGPAAFDQALSTFRNPLFKLLEIGLLGVVIVHALNGVRITLLDLGIAHHVQRPLFLLSIVVGALLFLLGAVPLFHHLVMQR